MQKSNPHSWNTVLPPVGSSRLPGQSRASLPDREELGRREHLFKRVAVSVSDKTIRVDSLQFDDIHHLLWFKELWGNGDAGTALMLEERGGANGPIFFGTGS